MRTIKDILQDMNPPEDYLNRSYDDSPLNWVNPGHRELWGLKNDFRPSSRVKKFSQDEIGALEDKMRKEGKL